ncbi:MAG: hypothetical protein A2Z14_08305 [Chloroflexi bacterium RBG_16_48_8]|nr:MAG: hypothetical protein A2Z14_08305 [Chloroflexi bacterium RBG_16_48_8]
MMEVLPKKKHRKKEATPNIALAPMISKPITKQPIVFSMKPEQERLLLKDLLGNFSDQTGASFG